MATASPRETVRALTAEAVAGLAIAWRHATSAQVAMERSACSASTAPKQMTRPEENITKEDD
jgi:hypothetical protein